MAAPDISGEIFRGWCPAVFPPLHAGRDTTEADTHRRVLRGCIFGPGCKSRRLHHLSLIESVVYGAVPDASKARGPFSPTETRSSATRSRPPIFLYVVARLRPTSGRPRVAGVAQATRVAVVVGALYS